MFKKLLTITSLMLSVSSYAQEPITYKEEIKNNLESKGDVKGIQELPMKKLIFVEAQQGTYIVSSDGRFVFEGTLKDVWHRKTIRTLSDAIAIQRTPVRSIGFEPETQLATFQFGNPEIKRQGIAFVDPTSPHTSKLLQYLDENKDEYNWTIILAPLVGGDAAVNRSRKLWCAENREQAKIDLMNGTSESFTNLKMDCPADPILKIFMLSEVFQIQNLPHIVREDGLSIGGFPVDFKEWFIQP